MERIDGVVKKIKSSRHGIHLCNVAKHNLSDILWPLKMIVNGNIGGGREERGIGSTSYNLWWFAVT